MVWGILACALIGYLLGGMNGAIMVSTAIEHEDVRTHGSGNAGLTNFLRSYGSRRALLVIFIDAGKVLLAYLIASLVMYGNPTYGRVAAVCCACLGHIFPVYFDFRGGKGIMSSAMLALCMDWRVMLVALACFIIIFVTTHYVSLGSIVGVLICIAGFILLHFQTPGMWIPCSCIGLLCIFMHRSNIDRLIHHQERKTYLKKKDKKEE